MADIFQWQNIWYKSDT